MTDLAAIVGALEREHRTNLPAHFLIAADHPARLECPTCALLADTPSVEPLGLTFAEWVDFLDGDEGVWHDRFGLWVQGKRDTAWLAERLAAALPTQASDSPEKP